MLCLGTWCRGALDTLRLMVEVNDSMILFLAQEA